MQMSDAIQLTGQTVRVIANALTAEDQHVCNKVPSAIHSEEDSLRRDALSKGIVQELVAPEVALQPADIQTVRVIQTIETRQFYREPDFVARVLLLVAIDSIEGDRRRDVARRTRDGRSEDRVGTRLRLERRRHLVNRTGGYLRRLATHEQSTKHTPGARAERRRLCLRGHGQPTLVDLYRY